MLTERETSDSGG